MIYGYARVSTQEQSTKLQQVAFMKNGIHQVHHETMSGVKKRPVLDNLIKNVLKPGDVLCVYKIDRLARSMSHFVRIFEQLKAKQVGFRLLCWKNPTQ